MIPQANVLDGGRIAFDVFRRQRSVPRQVSLLNPFQPVSANRRLDVVLDLRGLLSKLVWSHNEALQNFRIDACRKHHDQIERGSHNGSPAVRRERVVDPQYRTCQG